MGLVRHFGSCGSARRCRFLLHPRLAGGAKRRHSAHRLALSCARRGFHRLCRRRTHGPAFLFESQRQGLLIGPAVHPRPRATKKGFANFSSTFPYTKGPPSIVTTLPPAAARTACPAAVSHSIVRPRRG